jgi:PKD repeat protein
MPAWRGAAGTDSLVADFDAASTTRKTQLDVQFTDKSLGQPTSWRWSFGDGTSSRLKNPSHKYKKAGTYTVKLTVKDSAGKTAQVEKTNLIVVAPRK